VIQVSEERSQARNREIARTRLADLIRRAAEKPKNRIKTRVSLGQKRKRVEAKKQRGNLKALRGPVED
jgi:ribosome-associated protein